MVKISLILQKGPPKASKEKPTGLLDKAKEYLEYCCDTENKECDEYRYLEKLAAKLGKAKKLPPEYKTFLAKLNKFLEKADK